MLSSYMKMTYRNLVKNKTYTFINIFSLAIGLTCSMFLLVYIQDELSYDTHHPEHEQMYRVLASSQGSQGVALQVAFGEVFNKEYDDLIASRVVQNVYVILKMNGKEHQHHQIFWADKEITDVYSMEFLLGDRNALNGNNSVIISEGVAKEHFKDPLGKTIEMNGQSFIVTGVFKEFPENSHTRYNIIFNSYHQFSWASGEKGWYTTYPQTYFKAEKHVGPKMIEERLSRFAEKYIKHREGTPEDYSYVAQEITDIHFFRGGFDFAKTTSYEHIFLMGCICLTVLLIACINFMNLSTARAGKRAKEVGLRKTLGASKRELIAQFLAESLLLTFLAFSVALLFTELFLPYFNQHFQKSFESVLSFSPIIYVFILLLYVFVGLGAGMYPAFYLSKFNPVDVLKGAYHTRGGKTIRKALVVTQFAISTILIIYSLTIINQIEFMKSVPLGFDNTNITVIDLYDKSFRTKTDVFKEELMKSGVVENVSVGQHLPAFWYYRQTLWKEGAGKDEFTHLKSAYVDDAFFKTYGIELVQGRPFSSEFSTDKSSAIILNEQAVKSLGLKGNPIGQTVYRTSPDSPERKPITIVGITKNFHSEPLSQRILPLMVRLMPHVDNHNYVSIKTKMPGKVKEIYEKVYPDRYMSSWAHEDISAKYEAEKGVADFVTLFSIIAILISCAGLFGLVSFTAEQKTKEIGIRKILGATMFQLVQVFTKEFGAIVFLANILACPIALYFSSLWLNSYAYQMPFSIKPFVYAILFSLAVATFTVAYQIYKSSIKDPIFALRYE